MCGMRERGAGCGAHLAVEAAGRVAAAEAHEDKEQQHGGHEAAAVRGGQEAEHRKHLQQRRASRGVNRSVNRTAH